MKVLALIFMLLFSVSVLADCCNSSPFENATDSINQVDDCADDHSSSAESHDCCHCTAGCSFKILTNTKITDITPVVTQTQKFPPYIVLAESIKPAPLQHPPSI